MISGGHFELPLTKIPHEGFFGTLDMLLPDVYYFIWLKIQACTIYFRVKTSIGHTILPLDEHAQPSYHPFIPPATLKIFLFQISLHHFIDCGFIIIILIILTDRHSFGNKFKLRI